MQILNNIRILIGVIISVAFGAYFFGKKKQKEQTEIDENKNNIENVKRAKKIIEKNSALTRDELIDKL